MQFSWLNKSGQHCRIAMIGNIGPKENLNLGNTEQERRKNPAGIPGTPYLDKTSQNSSDHTSPHFRNTKFMETHSEMLMMAQEHCWFQVVTGVTKSAINIWKAQAANGLS